MWCIEQQMNYVPQRCEKESSLHDSSDKVSEPRLNHSAQTYIEVEWMWFANQNLSQEMDDVLRWDESKWDEMG